LSFEHPDWLWALLSIPLLCLLLWYYGHWQQQQRLRLRAGKWLKNEGSAQFWWKNSLKLGALACFLVAFANPQYGSKSKGELQEAADILIAVDVSRSMFCDDVKPDRMTQARIFGQQLVKALAGNRIGMIYFAGRAYLEMPFSTDYAALLQLLADAHPSLLSAQGTDITPVVELAQGAIDRSRRSGRALVIITDGEDHEGTATAAIRSALATDALLTFVVGVGTPEGANVPLISGGKIYESNGRPVLSQLNLAGLQELAEAGAGGPVFNGSDGQNAVEQLGALLNNLEKREVATRIFEDRESAYSWFLALGSILLIVSVVISLRPND
jgi:Ca-activated chloride channel homolog